MYTQTRVYMQIPSQFMTLVHRLFIDRKRQRLMLMAVVEKELYAKEACLRKGRTLYKMVTEYEQEQTFVEGT